MAVNRGMNARHGRQFRELVGLVLETEGFPEAEARPAAARLSDAFDPDLPATDITGIPGVTVHVRADAAPAWSTSLDMAERAAALDGNEHALLVEYRRTRSGGEAYALMSLEGWARLARKALGEVNVP